MLRFHAFAGDLGAGVLEVGGRGGGAEVRALQAKVANEVESLVAKNLSQNLRDSPQQQKYCDK